LEVSIANFKRSSNPICNVCYILQYPHIDVRGDLVHNIHDLSIYISCYEYVPSLKMAFIAETCRWWLLIDKAVFRLNLHLFYLLVYLNPTGMACQRTKYIDQQMSSIEEAIDTERHEIRSFFDPLNKSGKYK